MHSLNYQAARSPLWLLQCACTAYIHVSDIHCASTACAIVAFVCSWLESLSGRYLPLSGRYLPLSGRYLPLSGRYLPLSGRYLPLSGRYLPLLGRRSPPDQRESPPPLQYIYTPD